MSSRPSLRSSSWFSRLGGVLFPSRNKPSIEKKNRRRRLTVELLESRSLLSVTVASSVSGSVLHDMTQNGAPVEDKLSGITLNLYKDGGDGVFQGSGAGDDTSAGSTKTAADGTYRFDNLAPGTYFVREAGPLPAGVVAPTGKDVSKVIITGDETSGSVQTVIDSFDATTQYASASLHSGSKTGTASATATEALGHHRNLFVQLTTPGGAISLGANADVPKTLDFAASSAANGIFQVNWDGANNDPSKLNCTGLGSVDLTNSGTTTGVKLTLGADHDKGYVKLLIYTDAADYSWATVSIPATDGGVATQDVFIPWSDFSSGGGSGANLAKVGAVQLQVNGVNACDGQIGTIATVGPVVHNVNFVNVTQNDLAIVKTASVDTAVAGGQFSYTLKTTNNGPFDATGVTVTDTLPAGLHYVKWTGDGTVTNNGGALTIDLGAMANGAVKTTVIQVSVDSNLTGSSVVNTAKVTGKEQDSNPNNNTSTVTTPLTRQIDLAITKAADLATVKQGGQLTYTLTSKNNGPSDATGVTVTDTLPAGVQFVPTGSSSNVTNNNGVLTVSLGDMPAGGNTLTTTIVVSVAKTTTGTLTNQAEIKGNETETDLSNNKASCTTNVSVVVPPLDIIDLGIKKDASPKTVAPGNTLTYTLTVNNYSTLTAKSVHVVDTLPAGLTLLSVSAPGGTVTSQSSSQVVVDYTNMAAQAADTITITVQVNSNGGGSITNTATVQPTDPNQKDTYQDNNTASVTTSVVTTPAVPSKWYFLGR